MARRDPVPRCEHDLPLDGCHACRPSVYPKIVWISGSGDCFHASSSCVALAEGQRYAERLGFTLKDVDQVTIDKAMSLRREPCLMCTLGIPWQ